MSNLDPFITQNTDKYFTKTSLITERFYAGTNVIYSVFMRHPVIAALSLAKEFLREYNVSFSSVPEGSHVAATMPLLVYTGNIEELVELETILLQKIGLACITARNAYDFCSLANDKFGFIDMHARHATGLDFVRQASYGAFVGSETAKKENPDTIGFVGASTDVGGAFYGSPGVGTMPHALIGLAGSTLQAAKDYVATFPNEVPTILVDYYGKELSDITALVKHFGVSAGIGIRIDTHGGRYLEGLDKHTSCDIMNGFTVNYSKTMTNNVNGPGVSAAAVRSVRRHLNVLGATNWKVIVSSGFDYDKLKDFITWSAYRDIDLVGTGSFLPKDWSDTYATSDIIEYNGQPQIKLGREWLIEKSTQLVNELRSKS